MRKYFENQLEDKRKITEDQYIQLKGKPYYGEYKIGDRVLYFMKETDVWDDDVPSVNLTLSPVLENDLERLGSEFIFIRMMKNIPVLKLK